MPTTALLLAILITCEKEQGASRAMELTAVTALLATFLSLSLPSATPQGTVAGDPWGFSYVPGSRTGPEYWGKLREEWALCGTGRAQSPVDISDQIVHISSSLDELDRFYLPSKATLFKRGYDVLLQFNGDAGAILIKGTRYNLIQVHWHTPSEHFINGHQHAAEIHMVHQSTEGAIAVVGVLYEIGDHPDPFLLQLEPYIAKIVDGIEPVEVREVDPSKVVDTWSREYYRYVGSLTTPPCSEGVVWTVIRQVQTISWRQVRLLESALNFEDGAKRNARPIQLINDRVISYSPSKIKAMTSETERAVVKSWVN